MLKQSFQVSRYINTVLSQFQCVSRPSSVSYSTFLFVFFMFYGSHASVSGVTMSTSSPACLYVCECRSKDVQKQGSHTVPLSELKSQKSSTLTVKMTFKCSVNIFIVKKSKENNLGGAGFSLKSKQLQYVIRALNWAQQSRRGGCHTFTRPGLWGRGGGGKWKRGRRGGERGTAKGGNPELVLLRRPSGRNSRREVRGRKEGVLLSLVCFFSSARIQDARWRENSWTHL